MPPPSGRDADDAYMALALEEAHAALHRQEVPIGCVLVDTVSGRVLARASNRTNETRNATRHAELEAFDALRAADAAAGAPPRPSLAGVTLVVTCEPCIMCASALADALRPDAVVFGCWNDRFGGCGSVLDAVGGRHGGCGLEGGDDGEGCRRAPPFEVRGGVRAADAVALLKLFYETGNPTAPNPRRPVVPLPPSVRQRTSAD